ncbi:MAG: AI-2E family transporter [Minisyncoccia bacterium]
MSGTRVQVYFLFACLAVAATFTFFVFRPFLVTLALAAIFSVVLHPLYARILRSLGTKRALAALITLLIACIGIITPLAFIGTRVVAESQYLYSSLIENGNGADLKTITTYIGQSIEPIIPGASAYGDILSNSITTYAKQGLEWFIQHLGTAFSSVAGLLLRLFIFLMALYYFLKEGSNIRKAVVSWSFLEDTDDNIVLDRLSRTINSVVKGTLTIALIQGILTTIGFTLFGIPNAVIWGVGASIGALIPGIGTSLIIIPGIIFLFATGNTYGALGLLAWGVVVVGLIDNFLSPKLIGRGAQMNPLITLLSVLGGIAFFGAAGIFLGPITLSLLVALLSIYSTSTRAGSKAI